MFRHRGLKVALDTVQAAEFDIALQSLTEAQVSRNAQSLTANPNLSTDRGVGGFFDSRD